MRSYGSIAMYFCHSKSVCVWLHCFCVCVSLYILKAKEVSFLVNAFLILYGCCCPSVLCTKGRKPDWCLFKECAVTLLDLSKHWRIHRVLQLPFLWCSLYYENGGVVFKYSNHKVYPDELSVKKIANLFL